MTLRTVPDLLDELRQCVGALQAHFTGRRSGAPIEPALSKSVLIVIDRVLTFAKLSYEGYLRGALRLRTEENLVDAVSARVRTCDATTSASEMDFMLRGLLEVMDAVIMAPAGEWRAIAAMLQPLLDRYNEDVICDLFTAE